MYVSQLTPNLLVQYGREVLKVSTIYGPDHVTAQVVVPLPPRTVVRSYTAAEVFVWRPPSAHMLKRYNDATVSADVGGSSVFRTPDAERMTTHCPHCGINGTDTQVDEHRATGIHNDEPQMGSNLNHRPTL